MGRPKIAIDYETVEKLARMHCTQEEIATYMGISVRTLQRDEEFCRIYKKGIGNACISLRRLQWRAAEAGNKTMLVWLGRIYLKQTESMHVDVNEKALEVMTAFNEALKAEPVESDDDE